MFTSDVFWGSLGTSSSIVIEVTETVLFLLKKRFLQKNKTHKYPIAPKKHNKAHSLDKKCLDKIAKKNNFCLKARCNAKQ